VFETVTLDFETLRIEGRPAYPPRPVGLAIKFGDAEPEYMAFGHPKGNNCTEDDVLETLQSIWDKGHDVLFHNAKFDLSICYEYFGLRELPWHRVHDTLFLLFLENPHSKAIDLKSAAEELLDWEPEERDAVAEYVWENRAYLQATWEGPRISKDNKTGLANKRSTGEWMGRIPADVLAFYAKGDVERTRALFDYLLPLITDAAGFAWMWRRWSGTSKSTSISAPSSTRGSAHVSTSRS